MEKKKKILLLELNEFNEDLLAHSSKVFSLKNVQKLISLYHSKTSTKDSYESDFLEPWVQWVSVHTGMPSSKHKIKHLGDVPHLEVPQLWEKLSQLGVTSGIWGAMNASRASAKHCHFFLPDPWTASENAYPCDLNKLLNLLRYISKNYLNRSNLEIIKKLEGFFQLLNSNKLMSSFFLESFHLMRNLIKFEREHFIWISFLDYFSTLFFLQFRKKFNPDFSLLFLNSLAHLQHHHWKDFDYVKNEKLLYGLKYLDKMLGHIFSHLEKDTILIVTNALSQKNTSKEKPWILYRQIDPRKFLEAIGIKCAKIEPHMTHDAHLYFKSEKECVAAQKKLVSSSILNKPLFHVETYSKERKKLFYRVCFTEQIPSNAFFTIQEKEFQFFDLFKKVVQRTGRHIPDGSVYCNIDHFPKTIQNHEIFDCIVKLYD